MFKIGPRAPRLMSAVAAKNCAVLLLPVLLFLTSTEMLGRPTTKIVAGRRAIVVDERLSALRTKPDMTAPLVQRLRRGRVVGITQAVRGKEGQRFYRVAVTRRTRGWILVDAVVRAGSETDAARLVQLVEGERDAFARVKLASLCVNEFRGTRLSAVALLLLGESSQRAAEQLTRLAQRRLKADAIGREMFMLNDTGLDRYSRLGIRFRFEQDGERLVYDGAAYRELVRRYPRSLEATRARVRLSLR